MSNRTENTQTPASTEFLDLLLDALNERQAARQSSASPVTETTTEAPPVRKVAGSSAARSAVAQARVIKQVLPAEPRPDDPGWELPPRQPVMHLDRALWRFVLLALALVVLINLPLTRRGVSLARCLPDSAALIIRDGLVLKGSGSEIYILQGDQLRWISSLDAFEHMGLDWGDVHVVEDSFLSDFERGRPIHVLLKCGDSPHIYRLENGQKRWIRDIDTFSAEGHVWEDVRFVGCEYLRSIPDGRPIPEDAGSPPQL
jgi:hypothetical protein